MRSRAVNLPRLCCASTRLLPPPPRADFAPLFEPVDDILHSASCRLPTRRDNDFNSKGCVHFHYFYFRWASHPHLPLPGEEGARDKPLSFDCGSGTGTYPSPEEDRGGGQFCRTAVTC